MWRISATAFSDRNGGFPPQHFQIAMADFRLGSATLLNKT
jgi:hypothetical protein